MDVWKGEIRLNITVLVEMGKCRSVIYWHQSGNFLTSLVVIHGYSTSLKDNKR